MRFLIPLLLLCGPLAIITAEEQPKPEAAEGWAVIEAKGMLVVKDGHLCVQVRDKSEATCLIELGRTEDKNRALDEFIEKLKGALVVLKGPLRFTPGRTDGPLLFVSVSSESQIRLAKSDEKMPEPKTTK